MSRVSRIGSPTVFERRPPPPALDTTELKAYAAAGFRNDTFHRAVPAFWRVFFTGHPMRLLTSLIVSTSFFLLPQAPAGVERLVDGVLVRLPEGPTGSTRVVRVTVRDAQTFRVVASPQDPPDPRPSLVVEPASGPLAPFTVADDGPLVRIATAAAQARVNRTTGQVSFHDASGQLVLAERRDGRTFVPATVMGEQTWRVRQRFDSPADEALYGLGQHQDGLFNYKGSDVDLFQHNIVAAVPFLVSSRNYGLLWDNTSRTKFGDPREWQPLGGLALYDAKGARGGLTAEYFDAPDFTAPLVARPEPVIAYDFLDVHPPYPAGFDLGKGSVRWTGEISSAASGLHTFRLYASGYFKLWLDGGLVADGWRQGWLPWTRQARLHMQAGRRYPVRIEWIPDMGEAHIGLRWRGPAAEDLQSTTSFASAVGDLIDYYVVVGGTADQVIAGYRRLTGRAPMMPRWAMGLWQSRERYRSAGELIETVKEFRRREIPLDAIVQDWFYWKEDQWGSHEFDPERFPDPPGLVRTLHDLKARLMISVWPKFYMQTEHYRELDAKGFLYKRNIEVGQKDWVGPGYVSTFYDPYSSEARALFWSQVAEHLVPTGVDAWWLDATEPDVTSNLSDDERLLRMHPTALGSAARYENSYSLMATRTFYEGQRQVRPDARVFILTRSAFAGQQRYSAATWSGDIAARWYDLRTQIPAGLNFSLSGIPYWTTDIGGFAVERRYERAQGEPLEAWRELMTRWFQFGAFSPLFRVHGQFPYREVFNVAPEGHPAYETMVAFDRLRYRLLPYVYSLAGHVTRNHGTIMRALWMDFSSDTSVRAIGDEYMFGPAFLVTPVTTPMYHTTPEAPGPLPAAKTRAVYLPSGTSWVDFWTGTSERGGQRIDAPAPLDRLPLYVRAGSLVPMGPALQHTGEKPADPIELRVYAGADGRFTLYEDDGETSAYERGASAEIPLGWDDRTRTLTIGKRVGSFPGMLAERRFRVVLVRPGHGTGGGEAEADRVVSYAGEGVKEKF